MSRRRSLHARPWAGTVSLGLATSALTYASPALADELALSTSTTSNVFTFEPADGVDLATSASFALASLVFQALPPNASPPIGPSYDRETASVRGDASSIRAPRLAETTVPSWAAGVAALLTVQLPIGVGLYDGFSNGDWRETFEIIAGAGQSVSFSLFTSESLKRAFGRLRPDFLGRVALYERTCAADPDAEACKEAETTAFLDGQISFPSGHTAIAFSAAGYSALVLGGRFIWGAQGSEISAPIAGLTNLAMLGAATWIGVSRLEDHHHHATDVLAGMGIGLFWSNVAYWTRFELSGRVREDNAVQLGPGPGTAGLSLSGLL